MAAADCGRVGRNRLRGRCPWGGVGVQLAGAGALTESRRKAFLKTSGILYAAATRAASSCTAAWSGPGGVGLGDAGGSATAWVAGPAFAGSSGFVEARFEGRPGPRVSDAARSTAPGLRPREPALPLAGGRGVLSGGAEEARICRGGVLGSPSVSFGSTALA